MTAMGSTQSLFGMKLAVHHTGFPITKITDKLETDGKTRKQLGDMLIAIGIILKDEELPRDEKGRFKKKGVES